MATLLVSDLHLSPARTDIAARFVALLRGPAREAESLYVLGDLFDAWIGDDSLADPFNAEMAAELSALSAAGVPVRFQHGNRDFLLGDEFARRAGVSLLGDEIVADVAGVPTLLMHGDLLCTDDVEYQAMRAQFRSPAWQRDFLARPIAERAALARALRERSAAATAAKPSEITDVNDAAVAEAFRRHRCRRMIHGHTHRPARHAHQVDGTERERIVLADWYATASYLRADAAGIAFVGI